MPISALNQQTTPAMRESFPRYTDVFKKANDMTEENVKKIKQDTFEKSVTNETTYTNEVQNQITKTNNVATEKEIMPRETARESQKITTGLFNPREITNQRNPGVEMTSQTKEIPKIRSNDDITA